jgi:Fic family protein
VALTSESTPSAWPAIGHESREWVSRDDYGVRADRRTGPQIYNAAVPAIIADLVPGVPTDVAALAEDASVALTRFDAELQGEVAAFGAILLRSEAAASSRIENLTASARAILTAEIGATRASNAASIAANTQAMRAAIDLAEDLHPESILAMHAVLMRNDPQHTPGAWRQEPVWIGRSSMSPVGADFVGPGEDHVPSLIDDLVAFANRDDLPILTQVAVAHAQFETIHPFTDGNGRTGRALVQAMLRAKGLTKSVTVPVSAGLLTDVDGYHRALTSYRAGDIRPIVELTADASLRAIGNARKLVKDIRDVRESWNGRLTARRDSAAWKILDIIARQPVISAEGVAAELGIAPSNTYRYLKQLQGAGILRSKSEYKVGVLWRSDEILVAVDAFAERAGRRGR